MNKTWIRKLLIGAGVFVLLIAAVLTYLVASFDANAYKGLAIDWMKTHRDRTLVIDGPVKLSVFPRLAVQVSGVKLSERGRADEFMAIEEAGLSVAVLPLLRKQVVVDRVSARGLRVHYVRNDKGLANIDDLLTPPQPSAEPRSGPALRFDVARIQLDDMQLKLRDDKAKLAGEITLLSLSTGRLADQVESPVSLKARVALSSPAVQGELSGDTRLLLDLPAQGLHLRKMQLSWKGQAPGVQAMAIALRGTLAADGRNGTLRAEDVTLSGDATLGTLRLASSTLSLQRFAYDPTNKRLALASLLVKIGGTQNGHPLSLNLDWPALVVDGNSLTGSALTGQLSLQGPNSMEASFKTAAPSGRFERIVVPNVESTLKGQSGQRQFSGNLRATLLLDPTKGAAAIDDMSAQLQLQEPSLKPLTIAIEGRADASPQAAHWGLKGQINTNPFSTDGQAIFATEPLTLQANARFDVLDLNRLLLPPAAAASAPAAGNADVPIDLSGLRALQGQFAVQVGQLSYQTYRISEASIAATLEGGMLRVSKLDGRAWGGSFHASAFADARASRVALNAEANGVDVNALLKDVAGKDVLEGTGRVALNIEAAGRSVNEMKSRLKGPVAVQLRNGAIKGVNLAKRLRQAKARIGLKGSDERQKASQTEKTDFSELSASFNITDGVALNLDLDAKSPFLRLGGEGEIDIGKSRINYTARATVASTTKGQDGAELAALKGVTIPVQLTGPLDAIEWHIQWSAVAAQALKTEVGAKAEEKLKERLREQLKEQLGAASGVPSGGSTADAAKDKLKQKLKGLFK